jgi:sulfur carrier protein
VRGERKEDIMIILNGKEKEQYSDLSLTELLQREGYDIRKIAVEINGEIISKSIYNETKVKSGDKVEVVSFVGGG